MENIRDLDDIISSFSSSSGEISDFSSSQILEWDYWLNETDATTDAKCCCCNKLRATIEYAAPIARGARGVVACYSCATPILVQDYCCLLLSALMRTFPFVQNCFC